MSVSAGANNTARELDEIGELLLAHSDRRPALAYSQAEFSQEGHVGKVPLTPPRMSNMFDYQMTNGLVIRTSNMFDGLRAVSAPRQPHRFTSGQLERDSGWKASSPGMVATTL